MPAKTEWKWNATYLKMLNKAKAIIKEDGCMKFYDETKPLYIETDASEVGLGAALLQTRNHTNCHRDKAPDISILRPIAIASKTLPGQKKDTAIFKEKQYMALKKFYHYCFAREVSVITDHKPLITIFKKDVATLSQRLQSMLLRIHQYRVRIIYKPVLDLFMADWLSRHKHSENKDEEITGM